MEYLPSSLFLLLIYFFLRPSYQLKDCYTRSQQKVYGDIPCDPDAEVSSIAATTDVFSNRLTEFRSAVVVEQIGYAIQISIVVLVMDTSFRDPVQTRHMKTMHVLS